MGRYSTLQAQTQKNTTVVTDSSYVESLLKFEETQDQASGRDINNSEHKDIGKDERPIIGKKLIVNKVQNVTSSNAGASSSEFDIYRNARRREMERLDSIEKVQKEEEERNAYAQKVVQNKREAEERTKKNAEKRKKRKLHKAKSKRTGHSAVESGVLVIDSLDDDDDDDDDMDQSSNQRTKEE